MVSSLNLDNWRVALWLRHRRHPAERPCHRSIPHTREAEALFDAYLIPATKQIADDSKHKLRQLRKTEEDSVNIQEADGRLGSESDV